MLGNEDNETAYTWETAYERTWEVLREDETGSLRASVQDELHKTKRKGLLERKTNIRLGIMRHVYVILDLSQSMSDVDLTPTRQSCMIKLLNGFLDEFFDQNPISQLGLIVTRDKRAEKISELSGNLTKHKEALSSVAEMSCSGEPSLQNALELAIQTLRHLPTHSSREILIIFGSLSTCDPTNISVTVELLKRHRVRCSIIGLAAELHVCKRLCQDTNGTYSVILDEMHFKDILSSYTLPLPVSKEADSNLVKMGFPEHKVTPVDTEPSMCACHTNASESGSLGFTPSGYFCPQCRSKYCTLPVECRTCGLTLVSAPQLARSYQHLFPLASFQEFDLGSTESQCFGCFCNLQRKAYVCVKCQKHFCIDCDLLLHESLQTCPGCTT